jgi:hypothetical protein
MNTFGRMCGAINHGSCIRSVLGFGIKTGYDTNYHSLVVIFLLARRGILAFWFLL